MAKRVTTPARQRIADSDFLKQARDRFKLANEADTDQAQRERDDIAFEDGDQWPADLKLARMGQQPAAGLPAVPARPTLVINQVQEPIRQVLNQERQSDIGIELVPADDFGDLGIVPDDTEITLREGLVRRIQRESMAADARTWAFKRAVIAGRGYYLVMTRYLPGKSWDQEIYVHRIYNQAGVLLDPSHEQPDGSDAEWGFIGTWVPWERIASEYPVLADGTTKSPMTEYGEGDFIGMAEAYPDWYRQSFEVTNKDGKKDTIKQVAVRVVDYWYVHRESRQLALMDDGTAFWAEEVPKGVTPVDVRTVVDKQIKFCKIVGGVLEVEKTDWAGPDMPIVKVLGDEVLPYDEQRRARGMVRQSRDPQMGTNYMVSKMVETIGLSPIPALQVDPDAIDQYEAWYAVANVRTLPYLPSRTYDDQGRPLKEPHRPAVDPNILPIATSIQMFKEFTQTTTGGAAPNRLGTNQRVQAARAVRFLQEEEAFNTSNFLDNLARSIRYEGQVINNLLYPIYGTKPNRLVRTLTGEGESEMMLIGDPQQAQQVLAQRQKAKAVAKLTKDAHFNVIVKVAKSYQSRRDQESSTIGEMIAADPQLMGWFGDLYLKNLDGPGHKQMAERAKVMLVPPIQQMLAAQEKGGEPIPAAAQQQLAAQAEQIQAAEAAIQELAKQVEGKVLESQTKLKIADLEAKRDALLEQVRAQTELEKAKMDNATKIHVAEIAARTKGVVMAHEGEHEAVALAHEAAQADADRDFQRDMAASGMAHQAAVADGSADQARADAEAQRAFDADEAERGRQATAAENAANRQAQAQGDGAGI